MRKIEDIEADLARVESIVGKDAFYTHQYVNELRLALTASIPLDELRTLRDAWKNKRAVVLPCKVGDAVFAEDCSKIGEITDINVFLSNLTESARYSVRTCDYNNGQHLVHKITGDEFGVTVFLTRADAEAKLREVQG